MKRCIGFLWICMMVLGLGAMRASAAVSVPETVRVGIYFGSSALPEVTISAESGVQILCDDTDLGWLASVTVSQTDKNWVISGGSEAVTVYGEKLTVQPVSGLLTLKNKPYRGAIELVPNGNAITVVNHLGLEEYLYGVVPLEMSTGWPIEALKAQAVCARTFVARNMGKYMSQGFDVYNTTMSQVYGGAGVEKEDTTRAVDETRGIVITYGGALIDAVYFSASSNFKTFSVEDVWGNPFPYLVGVDDSYQKIAKPDCHAWTATFTRAELQAIADKQNMNIGTVVDLRVDEYSKDGAVKQLTFVGTSGTYTAKNTAARNILSLRSQGYTISKEQEGGTVCVLGASGTATVSAANAIGADGVLGDVRKILCAEGVSDAFSDGTVTAFILNGTGYGHGVGMSQYGARGMAESGFTYDQIIKHYYTGVELTD